MKNQDRSNGTLDQSWRTFAEWASSVLELFPALWNAAAVFAPLVLDRCEHCQKPGTILWFSVGDHSECARLDHLGGTDQ
jgi:hypothetical protein